MFLAKNLLLFTPKLTSKTEFWPKKSHIFSQKFINYLIVNKLCTNRLNSTDFMIPPSADSGLHAKPSGRALTKRLKTNREFGQKAI
jgi:hypothetical protein